MGKRFTKLPPDSAHKSNRSFQVVRLGLLGLITLVCTLLIFHTSWQIWREHRLTIQDGKDNAAQLARVFADHTIHSLNEAHLAMQQISEKLSISAVNATRSRGLPNFDLENANTVLFDKADRIEQIQQAMLLSVDGKYLASSDANNIPPFNHAPYAGRLQDMAMGVIDTPIKDLKSGRWLIGLIEPVLDDMGRRIGYVVATMDPDYFANFYRSLDFGRTGVVTILHNQGYVLLREPFKAEFMDLNLTNTDLFKKVSGPEIENTFIFERAEDGRKNILSSYKLEQFSMIVLVSKGVEELLTPWKDSSKKDSLLTGLIITLLTGLMGILWQQLARLQRMTRARAEDERRFQAIFNSTFQLMGLLTPEGRVLEANRTFLDFTASKLEKIRGRYIWDVNGFKQANKQAKQVHPQAIKAQVLEAAKGDLQRSQVSLISDDKNIEIDLSLKPLFNERGDVILLIIEGRDISAQTSIQQTLADKEQMYERMHANLPGIVFQFKISADGHESFPFISGNLSELYGLKPEQVYNDSSLIFASVDPQDLPSLRGAITSSKDGLSPWTSEYRIRRGKHLRWLRATSIPLKLDDGSTIWDGVIVDITSLKETESSLRKAKEMSEAANRAKSSFLAHMSHELRTPLNAIMGFSEILAAETFGKLGSERYVDYAQDIHSSGKHLLNLIDDLLDMSKIEAGRTELNEEAIEPAPLIERCMIMLKGRAEKEGVKLIEDLQDRDLTLFIDRRLIMQVIINLMTNAVKFTPWGGSVTIITKLDDKGNFMIGVKDTGVGIPKEHIERVFDPFHQAKPTHDPMIQKPTEGAGLGLAISRGLMELHGGWMSVESEPGVGSTFMAYLPASRVRPPRTQVDKAETS